MRVRFQTIFTIIVFVLWWGPPSGLFGLQSSTRDARSSMEGSIDSAVGLQIIVFLTSLLWVCYIFVGHIRKSHVRKIKEIMRGGPGLFGLYLLLLIISCTWSPEWRLSLYKSAQYAVSFTLVLFWGLYCQGRHQNGWLNILDKVITLSIICVGIDIICWFLFPDFVCDPKPIGVRRCFVGRGLMPAYGITGLIGFTWFYLNGRSSIKDFVLIGACLFQVLMTRTRAHIVILSLVFLIGAILRIENRFRRFAVGATAIFGLLLLTLFDTGVVELLWDLVRRDERSLTTLSGRLDYWQFWISEWEKRPLLGSGYVTGARWIFTEVLSQSGLDAHNTYLEALVGVGIVGLLLLLVALTRSLLESVTALIRNWDSEIKPYTLFLLVLGISLSIWGLTNNVYTWLGSQTSSNILCSIWILAVRGVHLSAQTAKPSKEK